MAPVKRVETASRSIQLIWANEIKFERREKLRLPAAELAAQIASGRHDPKCEVRPDKFMNLTEATVDVQTCRTIAQRQGRYSLLRP